MLLMSLLSDYRDKKMVGELSLYTSVNSFSKEKYGVMAVLQCMKFKWDIFVA